MRSKWTCPKCRALNQRTSSRKCLTCGGLTKPKRHVPKHALVMRDNGYQHFRDVNDAIHGAGDNCGVCLAVPKDSRNMQREHDHTTGLARGLACWRCNRLMPKKFDLQTARAIVAYLERVEQYYARDERSLHQLTENELRARVNLFTEDDPPPYA